MNYNIMPYKKRNLDINNDVYVYRNLVRKGVVYSIKQNGLVVAHAKSIKINNPEFIVNKSGQNRARITKKRNVHAYIKGKISLNKFINLTEKIYYNPFTCDGFILINKNKIIYKANLAFLNENGVFIKKLE